MCSSLRILIVTTGVSDAFTTVDAIGGMPALKTVTRAGISGIFVTISKKFSEKQHLQ
jgi:hypothetical protein